MKNVIFLFSKDCMSLEALPCYGGCTYWKGKTPNIDALFKKGTVFYNHYAAGASTAMSMSAMLTGHYCYEFKSRQAYVNVIPNEFRSIYDVFQEEGYETHLIWDYRWMRMAYRYVREFGDEKKLILHNIEIGQPAGGQKEGNKRLERDDKLLERTYKLIYDELDAIDLSKKQFVWLHLPHVLFGRRSYMDDMDALDNIVGHVRQLVGDDSIYFTTDHGHMNMHKHKVGYGFDLYQPIVHIPLITPRINGLERWDGLTSNIDLPSIMLESRIPEHDYVISETKYHRQADVKVAIISDRYKYIYNDGDRSKEFYDLKWDPDENYNMLEDTYYDYDRFKHIVYDELYFYPYKDEAMKAYPQLKAQFQKIWKDKPVSVRASNWYKKKVGRCKSFFYKHHIIKKKDKNHIK